MEKKTYLSLCNNNHKLSGNNYVEGRIFGIAEIICDLYGGVIECKDDMGNIHNKHKYYGGWWTDTKRNIKYFKMKCTEEQYGEFKKRIEGRYPGLLTFDWKG